jgi:hypothetical protein
MTIFFSIGDFRQGEISQISPVLDSLKGNSLQESPEKSLHFCRYGMLTLLLGRRIHMISCLDMVAMSQMCMMPCRFLVSFIERLCGKLVLICRLTMLLRSLAMMVN